jgi:hypothetical protein
MAPDEQSIGPAGAPAATGAGDATDVASDGIAFAVDLTTRAATPLEEIELASVGLMERDDLQRWITEYPQIVGPDLLLITTEFDRWQIRDQRVIDRLDVLLLDSKGSPVIAELKRDRASDTVELQALKYAAYCSQLTVAELVEEYARYHGVELEEARSELLNHAAVLEDREPGRIVVRLVAGEFGPAVTSVVLWLRDYDLDIGCIEVKARRVDGTTAVLIVRQLLPLPETEDFLVRRRIKEQEEQKARSVAEWTWEMYEDTYPADRVAIARELFKRMEAYVAAHDLPWTPALRSGWLGFMRPGNFYVPGIDLSKSRPIQFWVKMPDDPAAHGLANPYPELETSWDGRERQWNWVISTLDEVPDVARALDLSAPLQPKTGPMPSVVSS